MSRADEATRPNDVERRCCACEDARARTSASAAAAAARRPQRARRRSGRPRGHQLRAGRLAVRAAAARGDQARAGARGVSRGGRRRGAGAPRRAHLAAHRRGARRRWTRSAASSTSTSPGAADASSWRWTGRSSARSARRVLGATAEIPYGGVLSYARGGRRGRQPARLARGRQRARRQPDPDRRALPPRAAQRRRARRLRRRPAAQALPARARGRACPRRARSPVSWSPGCRLDGRRGPLRLGEVALGHALGRRHLGRVAQVPLGVERRLASGAGGGDRLAVGVVDEVAGGEHAGAVRARGLAVGLRRSRSRRRRPARAPARDCGSWPIAMNAPETTRSRSSPVSVFFSSAWPSAPFSPGTNSSTV